MVRWAAIGFLVLGVVHFLVLGADLPAELPRWLSLNFWTFEHWAPTREQNVDLALSGAVFWATLGSLAVPLMVLGGLLLWLDRRGLPIPPFVGWVLVAWFALLTAIIPPSGFPVCLAVSLVLAIGLQRRARSAA